MVTANRYGLPRPADELTEAIDEAAAQLRVRLRAWHREYLWCRLAGQSAGSPPSSRAERAIVERVLAICLGEVDPVPPVLRCTQCELPEPECRRRSAINGHDFEPGDPVGGDR